MQTTNPPGDEYHPRKLIRDAIGEWEDLRELIERLNTRLDDAPKLETAVLEHLEQRLAKAQARRETIVKRINGFVRDEPKLYQFAIKQGFRATLLDVPKEFEDTVGGTEGAGVGGSAGSGSGSSGGSGGSDDKDGDPKNARDKRDRPDLRSQAQDKRLLGTKGKDYDIVRGPKGTYVARYKYKIAGEVFEIGLVIPKDQLAKYGIKAGEGRQLSAAQMKRIERIGRADDVLKHIRQKDTHYFKAMMRKFTTQYEGQAILQDDEVMGVIIANTLLGWTPEQLDNQLRNTKYFQRSNEYQRSWAYLSNEQKQETEKLFLSQVVNTLEDHYGLDWSNHVQGGMEKAREWATKIASGAFGDPGSTGFEIWSDSQFDKAADIQGTNAWLLQGQQESTRLGALPNKKEQLRSEALSYLGELGKNRPLLDGSTLDKWAVDLTTGAKSDADWQEFLRQQMKTYHPYFDPNVSYTDQAAGYRALASEVFNRDLTWDDPLLRSFANPDNPKEALSLHEFEMKVRQDERAWEKGTKLWDEGIGIVQALESAFGGVTF